MSFEPKFVTYNVVAKKVDMTIVNAGPQPRPHKLIYGHWPYDRMIFVRLDLSVYAMLEAKLSAAYQSMDAYLEMEFWGACEACREERATIDELCYRCARSLGALKPFKELA
jgi:hypothetical protein